MVHWNILMTSGEFLRPQSNADVSRVNERLETLSPEEIEQWCEYLHERASERWDRCNNSFNALFDRLNLFNVRELSSFDIIVDKDVETQIETYLRVTKSRDETFATSALRRHEGRIIDRSPVETFSDTYSYYFGPDNSRVATITLRNDVEGVKLARNDGELINQRTLYETGILISALELEVLPSLEQTKSTLSRLWNAVQAIETNAL